MQFVVVAIVVAAAAVAVTAAAVAAAPFVAAAAVVAVTIISEVVAAIFFIPNVKSRLHQLPLNVTHVTHPCSCYPFCLLSCSIRALTSLDSVAQR